MNHVLLKICTFLILYSLLSCKGVEKEPMLLPRKDGVEAKIDRKAYPGGMVKDSLSEQETLMNPVDSNYAPLQGRSIMLNYGKDVKEP